MKNKKLSAIFIAVLTLQFLTTNIESSIEYQKLFNTDFIHSKYIVGIGLNTLLLGGLSYCYYIALKQNPLSFDDRVKFLTKELSKLPTQNLNINMIAALTAHFSQANLETFIANISTNHSYIPCNIIEVIDNPTQITIPIDMDQVVTTIIDISFSYKIVEQKTAQTRLNYALHEAGHALTFMSLPIPMILYHVSIIDRNGWGGYNLATAQDESKDWTYKDRKNYITYLLSGCASEQMFNKEKVWNTESKTEKIDQFLNSFVPLKNQYISNELAELLKLESSIGDITEACNLARYIIIHDLKLPLTDDEIYKILEECYQQAVVLVQKNKSKIIKLAELLIEKNIVNGDEIYNLAGTIRPLHVWEQ